MAVTAFRSVAGHPHTLVATGRPDQADGPLSGPATSLTWTGLDTIDGAGGRGLK
ncbi:hypothetical protein ACWY4P_01715 [Streptomyces sp. LZ34]